MRVFAIIDGGKRKAKPCAFLICRERDKGLEIVIRSEVDEGHLPPALAPFAREGVHTLDCEQSLAFVQERVTPAGGQVQDDEPLAPGATERGALERLIAREGRCAQDAYCFKEIPVVARAEEAADAQLAQELMRAYCEACGPGAAVAVGALLRERRKELGWSQSKLAARAGVQQAVVSRTENGVTNPTVGLLEDLARAMGKRVEIRLVDIKEPRDGVAGVSGQSGQVGAPM